MSRNIENAFSEEFLNSSVTITVREMGDIIAQNLADISDFREESADVEDTVLHMMLIELLGKFGASIMTDMFSSLDALTIEPNDPSSGRK